MPLFSNKQEANLRSCIQMIEEVIEGLGHVVDDSRLETQDAMPAWRVQKGSAHVYIIISDHNGDNHLTVTAPVMHLEDVDDRVKLYGKLLELNAGEIKGAAFALKDDAIVITAERSTVDLDRSEVEDLVKRVEEYADFWDDRLVSVFGGRIAGLSASPVR